VAKIPHTLRVIDDATATLTASRLFHAVTYDEPTVEGLLAVTALPVCWLWDFQDTYSDGDMNTLLEVTTQIGLAVLYPVPRGASVRREGRRWIAELQALLLADERRTHQAFLTEPVAAVIQPVADQTDRAAIYYQISIRYFINRIDPWATTGQ